jgi:hypothetical protein
MPATLLTAPDIHPEIPDFAGTNLPEIVHSVQPSLHFDSVSPRKPNPWPEAKERGTQVVGANPAVNP